MTTKPLTILAKRGTIYDRNFNKLAVTIESYDIAVLPKKIKNKDAAADALAKAMGKSKEDILRRMTERDKYMYLARGADVKVGDAVKALKIYGVDTVRQMKRVYPGGTLASHVLGFTNIDGKGIAGIEKSYDKTLRGTDGYIIADFDARGKMIPGTKKKEVQPIDGKDIVLTIDSSLQHSLETALRESYSKWKAAGATAIMADPRTGEILALANMPDFNPNSPGKTKPETWRNRAVTDCYEPGSTLKAITACAALDEGAIRSTDTFLCTGSMRFGRRVVHCSLHGKEFAHGHGNCTVAKMLCYSCNMAAAKIGLKVGAEKLYKYEDLFGIYSKPDIELPGAVKAWHDNWKDWADVRLANVSFGQGIAVTPIQLVRAYIAIANGGQLLKPFVVKEVVGSDGTPEKTFGRTLIHRVMSEETSSLVSEALGSVVTEGTASKTARVNGYRVAGKTGSAQKASITGRGYAPGKYISSFIGFLPISGPRVVILVAVDEPKGSHYGATVAAPVFQKVAAKAMWKMKVAPDDTSEEPRKGAETKNYDPRANTAPSEGGGPRMGG